MELFPFTRKARRRRIVERSAIPDDLWNWALAEHKIFTGLEPADAADLRTITTIFLGEKQFLSVRGIDLDDHMKVSVAAQACLPILKLGIDWYNGWSTLILTPEEFSITRKDVDRAGVIHEYEDELGGQVLELGPVILSWRDVEASGWGDEYNVVIHEMAHKIDERDGSLDGCPPLPRNMGLKSWRESFTSAYDDIRAAVDRYEAGRRRRGAGHVRPPKPKIDEYAAESPPEFFAVACEYFFESPRLLRAVYPEVYARLSEFFRQDPAERI
jgi:MtfA peptidase